MVVGKGKDEDRWPSLFLGSIVFEENKLKVYFSNSVLLRGSIAF